MAMFRQLTDDRMGSLNQLKNVERDSGAKSIVGRLENSGVVTRERRHWLVTFIGLENDLICNGLFYIRRQKFIVNDFAIA